MNWIKKNWIIVIVGIIVIAAVSYYLMSKKTTAVSTGTQPLGDNSATAKKITEVQIQKEIQNIKAANPGSYSSDSSAVLDDKIARAEAIFNLKSGKSTPYLAT